MKLAAKSRADLLAEAQREYRAAVASAPEPELRNAAAVVDLDAPLRFAFRGRPFLGRPTPYAEGVALLSWQARVKALEGRTDPAALEEYARLMADAVQRFPRLARPARLVDRVRWLGRNPFAAATEAEVAWLVGFFSTCRMIARVRHGKRS